MGLADKNVVLALCGGNIDVTTIARIIDRGLAADGRFCRVFARLLDRPGALANLTSVLASTGANIQEVSHDRHVGPATLPVSWSSARWKRATPIISPKSAKRCRIMASMRPWNNGRRRCG